MGIPGQETSLLHTFSGIITGTGGGGARVLCLKCLATYLSTIHEKVSVKSFKLTLQERQPFLRIWSLIALPPKGDISIFWSQFLFPSGFTGNNAYGYFIASMVKSFGLKKNGHLCHYLTSCFFDNSGIKVIIEKSRVGRFLWNRNWELGWICADWQYWKKKGLGRLWATFEGGFSCFQGQKKWYLKIFCFNFL